MAERKLRNKPRNGWTLDDSRDSINEAGDGGHVNNKYLKMPVDVDAILPEQHEPEIFHYDPKVNLQKLLKYTLIVVAAIAFFYIPEILRKVYNVDEAPNKNVERISDKQTDITAIKDHLIELNNDFFCFMKRIDENLQRRNKLQIEATSENLMVIDNKIREALQKYDADKLGLIDYALESAGGRITSTPETEPYPTKVTIKLFSLLPGITSHSNPRLVLQQGTLPGQCFAFYGTNGKIRINLAAAIVVSSVTIEHASINLIEDARTAPKEIAVYGLENADSASGDELIQFVYNIEGNPLQTFEVDKKMNEKSHEHVELHILSNYGHPEYTCVYRIRIHGSRK